MNKITFPLNTGMQGPEVDDLQTALQLLMDRSIILANDEAARQELSVLLRDERTRQLYSDATTKLVGIFQEARRLEVSGNVDEPTAQAINALLREWGLLDPAAALRSHVVSGQVRREDGLPLQDVMVRAMHEAERGAIRLGEDTTDAEGRYTVRFERLPGVDDINLRVLAIGEDGKPLTSSDVIRNAQSLEILDLVAPVAGNPATERRIEGHIVLEHGLPAEQLRLRLYRRDFGGSATLLGETSTLAGGQYAFTYDPGGKAVSLEVRAVKGADEEIPLSKPLNDLSSESRAILNLVAPGALQPLAAEYQRLAADLTPYVGQMTKLAEARENAERQDLTVLNRATGWDARLIALTAITERLSADPDVQMPPEAMYGLLRAGLPSDKLMLAQVEPDTAEQALKTVRDVGIVALSDEQIGQFKQQFATFSNKVRLAVPVPGSRSTYGELLKVSGLNDDAQAKFAPVYLRYRGNAAQLWDEVRAAGLDDGQIGKLQLQGKFAFLAGNSGAMTARLMQKPINDPVQLVEQDFHRAGAWRMEVYEQAEIPTERRTNLTDADKQKLAALIPNTYAGEKAEDRLDAYAEDMARKVRLSYPTQVVGRMIEQDEIKLPARDATVTLLKSAAGQGFRLGQTPVESFLKTHAGVTDGIAEPALKAAKQEMKMLQRVYQITPSNEAMPVLMSLGMTSAYDVTAYSEAEFIDLYAGKYLERYGKTPTRVEPELTYRKAKQVSSVTYNLFTIAKKLDSEAPLYSMSASAEVRESVKNELIKQFPTMESLFGSMDFCECEHCRSVLSPAAYLVDLLQFVDAEPGVWGNFLETWKKTHNDQDYPHKDKNGVAMKPYDVLIERRPDLPYIPLTCENTHTALPYIDVVNEILEYYVAHGKLEEKAAHDTGSATTAELLAEPRNVIREAYDKLREARYPLNLPFELWLETTRQFCNYFETPLDRVLETFRPSDDLFAPAQPFDRAAIFMELLGFSPAEAVIFTDPDPLAKWHELYGFQTVAEATTEATDALTGQRIDLNSAKALSRRLGVTYKEVVEIVQTGFVNPKLADLVVLYKLGVTIQDVIFYKAHKAFYDANKDLLGKERAELSAADKLRFDAMEKEDWERLNEVAAFEKKLDDLTGEYPSSGLDFKNWLNTELQNNTFDNVLVLADPDAGCNFDLTTLRYANGNPADAVVFLKINLFVRLWRKLGWSIEETDRALSTLIPSTVPFDKDPSNLAKQPLKTALIYLAHLKALDEQVRVGKQSRLKLLTLWSDLAINGNNPLYAQLLLTRNVLKSDPVFDHPLGQYLSAAGIAAMAQSRKHSVQLEAVAPADKIDPAPFAAEPKVELWYDELQEIQHLAYEGVLSDAEKATLGALSPSPALPALLDAVQVKAQEFSLVKGHLLALQGALGLTADEISQILVDAGKSLDTAELLLSSVSLLYRYGLLAKVSKLSVRELIALKQLSGLDPFKLLHPDPLTTLDEDYPFIQTLRFVEVAEQVKESGLKIEDLDYLLRHRFDETGKYRPNRESMLALLKTLAEGVRAIRTEHAVPDDPGALSEEVLRQKLGLALPPDVVERFLTMMNGTAEFTVTRTVVSTNSLHPTNFIGEPAISQLAYNETTQEQKLVFRGVLFDAQKAELKAKFNAKLNAGQQTTFGELLDDIQARATQQADEFFIKYLKKQPLNSAATMGFLEAAEFDKLITPLSEIKDNLTEDDKKAARKANEEQRKNKLAILGKAFFPFLQQRLIRQLIVQTMTTHTGADPALVESLLTDARLLAGPKPLLDAIAATGERGITAKFFASADGTGAALASLSFSDANTGLKDKDGNLLKPAGANSARFEGYLEVPTPGAYRFFATLDKKNAEAELYFDHLPDPLFWEGVTATDDAVLDDKPNEFLELKAGIPYRFSLDLHKLNGGEARLLVQGETLPKGNVSQLTLYPGSTIAGTERAILLLTKVLQLVQSLSLSEREIRYLLTHAVDFDGLSLSELPTQSIGDTPAEQAAATERFTRFLRLAAYARLKRDLAGGTDDLIGIFEANGTGDLNKVYPLIAKLTRRDEATVKAGAKALFTTPKFDNETPLQRLWEALRIVERFGVPVASLLEWTRIISPATTPEQRFGIARDLREAIKARFEPETWQRVAQPIFDKLRQRQRDALVAHIMHQQGFARMEQLYEYFLIDPGMEPVVQTSRIRLAIASLQLFVQRCLLNLEVKVHPSMINAKHWKWMKRYRVWEANRKIFLFPENWLEPEFRDDKTHLFSELEGALLQGDVSSDLVEDGFLNYLKKLDELARLDIVAMHIEDNFDPVRRTLHVFGRTYSQPHKYFYRRYAHQMWTPWEPVSAEIEGDHLAPVVWRDRLYLFWVTFMEKAEQPAISGSSLKDLVVTADAVSYSPAMEYMMKYGVSKEEKKLNQMTLSEVTSGVMAAAGKRTVEAHLHWSEYLQGEWSTRESGGFSAPSPIVATGVSSFNSKAVFIHVSKEPYENGEERGVYIHLGGVINQAFYLAGCNSAPEKDTYGANDGPKPDNPFSSANGPLANRYSGSGPFKVSFQERITTEPGKTPPKATPSILEQGSAYTLLPCDNNLTALGVSEEAYRDAADPAAVKKAIESSLGEIASLMKPVFYQDNQHTLFVEPNVTERTIEEWQEWVTRTPQLEPDWIKPDWWKDIVVIPEWPGKPIPDPRDPRFGSPIYPGSRINPKPEFDWLVNPGTGLLFDDVLIGPAGQPGIDVLMSDAAGVMAGDGTPVNVNPGSGLALGSTVVLSGATTLEQSGLMQVAGGLNVVGGSGFNSALENNFNDLNRSYLGAGRSLAGRFGR